MEYNLYIFLILELFSSKQATIAVKGRKLEFFVLNKRGQPWQISAKIVSPQEEGAFTKEFFQTQKRLFFHCRESFISQKDTGVFLERETPPLSRYTVFKQFIDDFMNELADWETVFKEKNNYSATNLG